MKKRQGLIYTLISIVVITVIWFIAARIVGVEFLLPSPIATLKKLFSLFAMSEFYRGIAITSLHAIVSFAIAFVIAAALAVLSSISSIAERLLSPIVLIIRVAPTMSVIFLSVLWIASENSPYLVGVFVLFPMIYARILSAIKSVDPRLIEMAKVYGVRKRDIVKDMYLPHVANSIIEECSGILSFGVKLAVSGEAVAQSGINIGSLMSSSKANFDTAEMIAYTVAAILVGFLLELLFKLIVIIIRRLKVNAQTNANNKEVRQ